MTIKKKSTTRVDIIIVRSIFDDTRVLFNLTLRSVTEIPKLAIVSKEQNVSAALVRYSVVVSVIGKTFGEREKF